VNPGLGCALALVLAGPALAQRRSAQVARTSEPPVVDGRLDDAVWALATPIGELLQIEPRAGQAPSEATEIRFLYDARHLYVAVRCFDRDPARIVATQAARDAVLDPDDRVELVFDTYLDRRNAFFFQMSPAGSKGDALISGNGRDFNKPWDGIWEGRSAIDDQGWSFELALPFQTLNFAPGGATWGFNCVRHIKRRNEVARWNDPSPDHSVFQISEAGELHGLAGLEQGLGLDFVPFFHADWTYEREDAQRTLLGQPGFDAFYKLTPGLQASLTVNTDFAETEVDERRVNLTRFPLFFPEKRDFFLQDAGIFAFADSENAQTLVPFFSRRIGLDDNGQEVPIDFGGKLTGRHDDWNIGALGVRTGAVDELEEQDLFVARLARNLGEQSTLGGIYTQGDPAGGPSNRLYGLDYNYRDSNFRGSKVLSANLWGLRTETEGLSGRDHAAGAATSVRSDEFSWRAGAYEVGENFAPALGFVQRTGVKNVAARVEYDPRLGGDVRQLHFLASADLTLDAAGDFDTFRGVLRPVGVEWDSGDRLDLELLQQSEQLDAGFEIQPGITIPAGDYDELRLRLAFESALKRPVSTRLALEGGGFFDGRRTDLLGELSWRPSARFQGSCEWSVNDVDLPQGDFQVHVGRLRANLSFSPDLDWFNFLQADNGSDSLGWNSRLRWIVRPGHELFLVWNETWERQDDGLVPTFQEAAFKLSYTLRF